MIDNLHRQDGSLLKFVCLFVFVFLMVIQNADSASQCANRDPGKIAEPAYGWSGLAGSYWPGKAVSSRLHWGLAWCAVQDKFGRLD